MIHVYWNLNRGTWSVRRSNPQKVIIYSPCVVLKKCLFTVQNGGRQRVLNSGVRNVHAWVKGFYPIIASSPYEIDINIGDMIEVSYNPFLYSYFYDTKNHNPILSSDVAVMWNKRVFINGE